MRILQLLFLFLSISISLKSQVSFEATSDAKQVLTGSTFQVQFTLHNAEGGSFTAPDFGGLQIVQGPSQSMQTSIINGSMSSSLSYVYVLTSTRLGTFTIGSATIRVGRNILKTKPIQIEFLKSSNIKAESKQFFIKATLDTTTAYVGQQITLSYKLYTQVSIQNIEVVTGSSFDDFYKVEAENDKNGVLREIINGQQYTTKVLGKIFLFPLKAGHLTISPVVYRVSIGEDDPWGFNMSSIFRQQMETVLSNELSLKVLPLPKPIPQQFSGAVGQYKIDFKGVNQQYNLSDAINISMYLEGDGNLNQIKPNIFNQDTSFEFTESRVSDIQKAAPTQKLIQSRYYDYLLTPKKPGAYTLKPEFIFFNPYTGIYESVRDSFNVQINSQIVKNEQARNTNEIRDIYTKESMSTSDGLLWNKWFFWVFLSLPVLLGFIFKTLDIDSIKKIWNQNKSTHNNLSHKTDSQGISNIYDLELLFIRIINTKLNTHHQNLQEIKQYLALESDINLKLPITNLMQEFDFLKYTGTHNLHALQEFKQKLDLIIGRD